MGTWSVTSGITNKVTQEEHNFVYGYHAVKNQYIVHEASPTSARIMNGSAATLVMRMPLTTISLLKKSMRSSTKNMTYSSYRFSMALTKDLDFARLLWFTISSHTRRPRQAVWEGILFCHNPHLDRMKSWPKY